MDRGPPRATPHNYIFSFFCIFIELMGCYSVIIYFSVLLPLVFFGGLVLAQIFLFSWISVILSVLI